MVEIKYIGEKSHCKGCGKTIMKNRTPVKLNDGTYFDISDIREGYCFDCSSEINVCTGKIRQVDNGKLLDITNFVEINNVCIGWLVNDGTKTQM